MTTKMIRLKAQVNHKAHGEGTVIGRNFASIPDEKMSHGEIRERVDQAKQNGEKPSSLTVRFEHSGQGFVTVVDPADLL